MKNILNAIKESTVGKATTKVLLIWGIASQLLVSCNETTSCNETKSNYTSLTPAQQNDSILNTTKAPVIVSSIADWEQQEILDNPYNFQKYVRVVDSNWKTITLNPDDDWLDNIVKWDTLKH